MSKVTGYIDTIDGNCGVGVLSGIESFQAEIEQARPSWAGDWWKPYETTPVENLRNEGGCGWLVSGFIPNRVCKEAYEALCAKHVLVYQSPVRRNSNSGRRFFFCIFDTGRRRRAT